MPLVSTRCMGLHGLRAVAPLRRVNVDRDTCVPPVSTASGPWPHCGTGDPARPRRSWSSPRPQGRGPIAATRIRATMAPLHRVSTASGPWPHCGTGDPARPRRSWSSPRPQGRGPIAAEAAWSALVDEGSSPRPQGRGPIAAKRTARSSSLLSGLHGLRAVAPLRRHAR